jgi:hypothetical protein
VNLLVKLNPIGYVAVLLVALSGPGLAATGTADSFDAPLKKKVVNFGPSPYYPAGNFQNKLSCYFYPRFMVKQYDEGEKGAEWLAIAPIEKGAPAPECTKSHAPGERVIEQEEWSGYFLGVKGNLVFFDAADGFDGGLAFVVYDATTGKKIFRDSRYEASMWKRTAGGSAFNRLRVYRAPSGGLSLKYLRVVATECDLHQATKERASCWQEARKKLELKSTQMPLCSCYKRVSTRLASAVAYPVEVSLFPQPVTRTIDGPVKCWPVD